MHEGISYHFGIKYTYLFKLTKICGVDLANIPVLATDKVVVILMIVLLKLGLEAGLLHQNHVNP